MHLRTGGDYVEFVLEHARHRGDFQGGITGGDKWRPVNKEKASAFLSTQEPNYLASGNIKQKLMSTTKVVKKIEKLQGTEDAPLVV